MDGGAWYAAVHGVGKSQTRVSNFTFTFQALEKEMATHPSTLAWKIPWTEEPGRLQPTRSQSRFNKRGSSLVAQWLRLSMQGGMGLIPGQGRSHMLVA